VNVKVIWVSPSVLVSSTNINVSEECVASIFRVEQKREQGKMYVNKRLLNVRVHSISGTKQKEG
jgi:hypothetical protein